MTSAPAPPSLLVPVSVGELLDKITILRIKSARIADPSKLANVSRELAELEAVWAASSHAEALEPEALAELQAVNEALWDIEDRIREKEHRGEFDADFIELARAVYVTNDRRAAIKRTLNLASGSALVEEKSYADYGAAPRRT